MRWRLIGAGETARILAAALEAAGHEVERLAPAEAAGGPLAAALQEALAVDAEVRLGAAAARAPASPTPSFELHLADPPEPMAATWLSPLLEGRGESAVRLAGPGGARWIRVPVRTGERGARLLARLARAAVAALEKALAQPPAPESDAPRPGPAGSAAADPDPTLDWTADADALVRQIRAWAPPLPGARTTLAGELLVPTAAERAAWTGPRTARPGALHVDASGVRVRCGSGALRLLGARAAGRALDRAALARALHALGAAGERLESPAPFLPFGVPALGRAEEEAVVRTLRTRWIGTGPEVAAFEREFCEATGARHAVAVSSCTAALHLALLAAGVGPGDEVVTSSLTFVATVNAILYTGARPVLADVDPHTLNLDPDAVEAACTPRTRAIVPVHFGGLPCDMARLRRLALRRGLALVEDAAHAVGARYRSGRDVGSGAFDTCFSFYPNKNLTSCEGGMITTRSAERARRYRRMRMHGLTADAWKRFGSAEIVRSRMVELGFKYNLTDLQAALGRVQLGRLEAWTRLRGEQAAAYREAFAELEQVRPLAAPGVGRERHAYHLFTVRVRGLDRDLAQLELRRRGVGAAIHYEPVHLHPFYRARLGIAPGTLPVAEAAGAETLTLPIGPSLRAADVARVVEAVRAVDALAAAQARRARAGSGESARVSPPRCEPRPTTSPTGWPGAAS